MQNLEHKLIDATIKRLITSSTPDRGMDGDMTVLLGLVPPGMDRNSQDHAAFNGADGIWFAPKITTSMDVAFASFPPSWRIYSMTQTSDGPWSVAAVSRIGNRAICAEHADLVVALCLLACEAVRLDQKIQIA
jgi:hypothetical protein